MHNILKSVLFALAVLSLPVVGRAGLPVNEGFGTAFTYQGLLQSSSSSTTGNYDFEFRLFDAEVGGAAVGPVTANAIMVQDGLFNVSLDFGQAFAAKPKWLEISVRPSGSAIFTVLAPRQRLNPATQAIYAATAGTADTATTSTAALNGVPSGFSILGSSEVPPPGYSFTGGVVKTGGAGWTSAAAMSPETGRIKGAVIEGKLYVVADGSLNVYDPQANAWESKTPMPTNRGSLFSVAAVGGKLYVLGGRQSMSSLQTVDMYDPDTDTWTPKEDMPTAKDGATAAVVNGKIYSIDYNSNEVYDPALDDGPGGNSAWALREAGTGIGQFNDSAVIDGKIYIFGGNLSDRHVYDPTADDGPAGATAWSLVEPLPVTRNFLSIVALDGKIYAMGGEFISGGTSNANDVYDPINDQWTVAASLPTPREFHVAEVINGKIYLAGGIRYLNDAFVNISNTDIYEPVGPSLYVHVKD